ncbi:MAG: adenosylmethionine--8-amino-7-oxononanoate transaminase [Verrucomicrobia bacterium]|nr:adenosylmethionine--8-amino-7-oxononanoate transaminase [Verrucomicrobiota bacterium]MCF7707977.1 adenosylmethionine--8-amino-7-oxononanoate transaminase [Verrucomicrobiota bacterium]
MNRIAELDHRYIWHPFTQMKDWLREEPIVIISGKDSTLEDINGNIYLDANSSIWTNIHGHNNPYINDAVIKQLNKIAHSSALGLANEPASILASELVSAANPDTPSKRLEKVFFSDNGSTALEVAIKLAYEFIRRAGKTESPRFLSFQGAYHGDTIGAVSVGHIDLFHKAYSGLLFKTDTLPAPYCYRCKWNKAEPERADARKYRRCNWECIRQVHKQITEQKERGAPYSAIVYEPLIQGAAGMIPQPQHWLRQIAEIADENDILLIADEVFTGFGRTGAMFASHREDVQPDFMALAKAMTSGYMPMAATLTTKPVFNAFLGEYEEFKSFFHGHSFTANQLGSSAALASLQLLHSHECTRQRQRLISLMAEEIDGLWNLPAVGDIRREGLIAAVELVANPSTKEPFPYEQQIGLRVCKALARRGVLTRNVGDVIPVIPPYCTTDAQLRKMIAVLADAVQEVCAV